MRLVVVAVVLYVFAAIAGTCYVVVEVLGLTGTTQDLAIGGALAVLAAPTLWLLWRRSPSGVRAAGHDGWRRREQERIARRVAELRGDAGRERFIPLVERGYHLDDAQLTRWLARLRELEAVPHRRRYVADLLDGREFSDAQIDYLEFPDRLATCAHLQAVERALRDGGQRPALVGPRQVHVGCQLRFEVLRGRFALPPGVVAVDVVTDPRGDVVDHRLRCESCDSEIRGEAYGRPWPA